MTNEEKSKEIAQNNRINYYEGDIGWGDRIKSSEEECYDSAMEMAEWKDEQFAKEKQALIDKACEWVTHYFKDFVGYNCSGELIKDFEKALKNI